MKYPMLQNMHFDGARIGHVIVLTLMAAGLAFSTNLSAQSQPPSGHETNQSLRSHNREPLFTTPDMLPAPSYRRIRLPKEFVWKPGAAAQPSEISHLPAKWIQLHFDEDTDLGDSSYVTITGSNGSQKLTAKTLAECQGSSYLFNDNSVRLEVNKAVADRDILVLIREVTVGQSQPTNSTLFVSSLVNQCPIGAFNSTANGAVGRIMLLPCTGWIISNSAHLSAGHCSKSGNPNFKILQFQVPPSDADGALNHPSTKDQYCINLDTIKQEDDPDEFGRGQDWAVFDVYPNTETNQMPVEKQNTFYRLSDRVPVSSIGILGYAFDESDPQTDNYTQQRPSDGIYSNTVHNGENDVYLTYSMHTEAGMSGGPVVEGAGSLGMGIHTNGCRADPGAATSFQNKALKDAIESFEGPVTVFVDQGHPETEENGSIFRPFDTLEEGLNALAGGGVLSVVTGTYELPNETTIESSITISAPVGPITIQRN